MSMARVAAVVALAAAVFAAHAGRAAAAPPQELVVFEAASLKDAFAGLAQKFQAEHAGIAVTANPAGSQELRMQIEHGARADVFASAESEAHGQAAPGGAGAGADRVRVQPARRGRAAGAAA